PLRGAVCVGWGAATLPQDRTGRQKPAHLVLNLSVRFTTAWVGQIWGGSFLPSAQGTASRSRTVRRTSASGWKGKRIEEPRTGSPDLREEVHGSDEYIFFGQSDAAAIS